MQAFHAFTKEYFPDGDAKCTFSIYGYAVSNTLEAVLQAAGDEFTRENVMK